MVFKFQDVPDLRAELQLRFCAETFGSWRRSEVAKPLRSQ
jgi:hypothetical protein